VIYPFRPCRSLYAATLYRTHIHALSLKLTRLVAQGSVPQELLGDLCTAVVDGAVVAPPRVTS
jgi:hypothetical protein